VGNDREDITLNRRQQQRRLAVPYAGHDLTDEDQLVLEFSLAKRAVAGARGCIAQQSAYRRLDSARAMWQQLHPGAADPGPWVPALPKDADAAEAREYYEEVAGGFDLESVIQAEISRSNLRVGDPACPPDFRLTHPYSSAALAERLQRTPRQVRSYVRELPDLGKLAPRGFAPGKRARWYGAHDLARVRLVFRMGEPDPGPETARTDET
jgi:hypothetical protein